MPANLLVYSRRQNLHTSHNPHSVVRPTPQLGWVCKALILRDSAMLWTLSIGFELMELTFQHMLPNFNECWWDSWILDVALCNFIGIWAGMKVRFVPIQLLIFRLEGYG